MVPAVSVFRAIEEGPVLASAEVVRASAEVAFGAVAAS